VVLWLTSTPLPPGKDPKVYSVQKYTNPTSTITHSAGQQADETCPLHSHTAPTAPFYTSPRDGNSNTGRLVCTRINSCSLSTTDDHETKLNYAVCE